MAIQSSNEAARLSNSAPKHYYSTINNDEGIDDELGERNKLKNKISANYEIWNNTKFYIVASLLLFFISVERVSFKVLADRMLESYLALLVGSLFCSALLQALLVTWKALMKMEDNNINMSMFPHRRVLLIATLDAFVLFGFIFATQHILGVYSIIFIQCNLIGVVIFSRFLFPDRKFTNDHWFGIAIVSAGLSLLLLLVIFQDLVFNHTMLNIGYLTAFICCCLLQGLSVLFKQKILIEWSVPLDTAFFNLILFIYQLIAATIISLLYYAIEAFLFGKNAKVVVNLMNGYSQLAGYSTASMFNHYIANPWLLMIYTIASFGLVNSFEYCSNISSLVINRMTAAGTIIGYISLLLYEIEKYSLMSIVFHVIVICTIVIGLEIYNKSSEPDMEMKICLQPPPNEATLLNTETDSNI